MGGKKSTYGADGRGDLLMFEPSVLKVITDPQHPQYDPRVERPIDEAMVISIMRLGVIEPLVIARDGDTVYVVDGRQRRANAIEANRRLKAEGAEPILVPCTWRRGDDARLFEIMVAANEVRSADSLIERAKKMQRLADMGRNEAQIAAVFGCTAQTVRSSLALLECAPVVQRAVEAGELPTMVATKLSKLPREEQKAALDEMKASGAMKGKAAHRAAEAKTKGKKIERRSRMRSRAVVERLRKELAAHPVAVRVLDFVLGKDMPTDDEELHGAAIRALDS